jgi:2-alkyl-3-oxoalkanoate reductase
MNILVTGGNGFLGSRILRYLGGSGHSLYSVQRSDPAVIEKQEGVSYLQADLSDRDAAMASIKGMDLVFHVAAKAGIWGKWEDFFDANVTATEHVVAACIACGVKKLIYTSTPSVVFTGEPIRGWDERAPYGKNWLGHYAQTKCIAESLVLTEAREGRLEALALRPHLIWGAGEPHILPRLVRRARAGRLRIVGDGNNRVDITHVDNAAHAHICAMRVLLEEPKRVNGNAYFISDGAPVLLWPWINEVLASIGLPPLTRGVPLGIAYSAGYILETIHRGFALAGEPAMTRFVATELAKDHYFNISKAREDLGYQPIADPTVAMEALAAYLEEL